MFSLSSSQHPIKNQQELEIFQQPLQKPKPQQQQQNIPEYSHIVQGVLGECIQNENPMKNNKSELMCPAPNQNFSDHLQQIVSSIPKGFSPGKLRELCQNQEKLVYRNIRQFQQVDLYEDMQKINPDLEIKNLSIQDLEVKWTELQGKISEQEQQRLIKMQNQVKQEEIEKELQSQKSLKSEDSMQIEEEEEINNNNNIKKLQKQQSLNLQQKQSKKNESSIYVDEKNTDFNLKSNNNKQSQTLKKKLGSMNTNTNMSTPQKKKNNNRMIVNDENQNPNIMIQKNRQKLNQQQQPTTAFSTICPNNVDDFPYAFFSNNKIKTEEDVMQAISDFSNAKNLFNCSAKMFSAEKKQPLANITGNYQGLMPHSKFNQFSAYSSKKQRISNLFDSEEKHFNSSSAFLNNSNHKQFFQSLEKSITTSSSKKDTQRYFSDVQKVHDFEDFGEFASAQKNNGQLNQLHNQINNVFIGQPLQQQQQYPHPHHPHSHHHNHPPTAPTGPYNHPHHPHHPHHYQQQYQQDMNMPPIHHSQYQKMHNGGEHGNPACPSGPYDPNNNMCMPPQCSCYYQYPPHPGYYPPQDYHHQQQYGNYGQHPPVMGQQQYQQQYSNFNNQKKQHKSQFSMMQDCENNEQYNNNFKRCLEFNE